MLATQKEITLREAAELTGYASDYVGSLIRSGKIPGKRVVGTSAWVTTEEAILTYTRENRGGRLASRREHALALLTVADEAPFSFGRSGPITLLEVASGAVIVISLLFSFFLFNVYSVVSDKASLQATIQAQRLEQRIEREPASSFYEK